MTGATRRGRAGWASGVAAGSILISQLLAGAGLAYERPGSLDLLSINSEGKVGNAPSSACGGFPAWNPAISANERYVAFNSRASNLDPRDRNDSSDTFVHDTLTGKTEIVSLRSTGAGAVGELLEDGCGGSTQTAISANGRYVAFASSAIGLTSEVDANVASDVFVHDRKKGSTELISIDTTGRKTGAFPSGLDGISISANGRYVTFDSGSPDLVDRPSCIKGHELSLLDCVVWKQIYVRDRQKDTTSVVSVDSQGRWGNDHSFESVVSGNGRHVVFVSEARNLDDVVESGVGTCSVAPASSSSPVGCVQVFSHDLRTHKTRLVSRSLDGGQANARSWFQHGSLAVSYDGSQIAFFSPAGNMVPNNGPTENPALVLAHSGVFVVDRKSGRTEKVNVSSSGEAGMHYINRPSISSNGRFVAWASGQTRRILVHDRRTGALETISWGPEAGREGLNGLSISSSGRFIPFVADLSLTAEDSNQVNDVYLHDRGDPLGAQGLVGDGKLRLAGAPRFSSSGVVSRISQEGDVAEILAAQGADLIGARLAYRAQYEDLYVVLELEDMPSARLGAVTTPVVHGLRLNTPDDRYEVRISSTVLGAEFALFDCTARSECFKIADLSGGYGTTGERLVFALPLEYLQLNNGGEIRGAEAYSQIGDVPSGAGAVLDSVELSK